MSFIDKILIALEKRADERRRPIIIADSLLARRLKWSFIRVIAENEIPVEVRYYKCIAHDKFTEHAKIGPRNRKSKINSTISQEAREVSFNLNAQVNTCFPIYSADDIINQVYNLRK